MLLFRKLMLDGVVAQVNLAGSSVLLFQKLMLDGAVVRVNLAGSRSSARR